MKVSERIHYVGVQDRTKHRFEGQWLLPQGISYNAYLVDGGTEVALVDTVEADFFDRFLENMRQALGDRQPHYLVINHMEPDHSGSIALVRRYFPEIRLVGNKKTFQMVEGFYGVELREDDVEVKEGDTLSLGDVTLRFHMVPMLHWPETMVTYMVEEETLFSGDAFGCFGALNGAVVDEQMDVEPYFPEMERYYAAILGKYAIPVQQALRKLSGVTMRRICATHGPVWTTNVPRVVDTYRRMSEGETEEGVVVCYGSMYGNSQRVAEAVAEGAAEAGVRKVIVHNLSVSQPSFVLRDIFRYRGLAVGGPTYNGGLFPVVDDLLKRLAGREVSRHQLALFGGFTWAGQAVKIMRQYNETMKMQEVGTALEWKQGAAAEVLRQARELGRVLGEAVRQ
ncbi:MAG: FprA family A-type flavoprotein [Alloprevotella sp.]|nr:FprA family A-type flavoprotein [Alloprevotella sp.]